MVTVQNFTDGILKAFKEGWWYIWGGYGELYTEAHARQLLNTYKSKDYNEKYYLTVQPEKMGGFGKRKVADCSGLCQAVRAEKESVRPSQVESTADGLYNNCKIKGKIGDIGKYANVPVLVFRQNSAGRMVHVGYQVIDSSKVKVYEMRGSNYPCVCRNRSEGTWTHWGIPTWLDYETIVEPGNVAITPSSSYNDIMWLQKNMNKLFELDMVEDGLYGKETKLAVQQIKGKLKIDNQTNLADKEFIVKMKELLKGQSSKALDTFQSSAQSTKVVEIKDIKDYKVKVKGNVGIHESANVASKLNGKITDNGVYTITHTSGNWGKLKSGAGWIHLGYTERV